MTIRGTEKGLIKYLNDFSTMPLFAVHCLSHRLQLAFTHSTKNIDYFDVFETTLNNIYSFYMTNSHKRFNHLKQTVEFLGEKLYALNYIYKIRWISSEATVIEHIRKMWGPLVIDLGEISEFNEFDKKNKRISFKIL